MFSNLICHCGANPVFALLSSFKNKTAEEETGEQTGNENRWLNLWAWGKVVKLVQGTVGRVQKK